MKFQVEPKETYIIIEVMGSLSNDTLLDFKNILRDSLKKAKNGIIINLKAVDFICSAALGVFFSINVDASQEEKKLILCNLEEDIQKLLLITGVNRHLTIFPTLEASVKEIS